MYPACVGWPLLLPPISEGGIVLANKDDKLAQILLVPGIKRKYFRDNLSPVLGVLYCSYSRYSQYLSLQYRSYSQYSQYGGRQLSITHSTRNTKCTRSFEYTRCMKYTGSICASL